ncbi:hypothetical protein [Spiribacter vilamensis]|uniref:Uncharacterized protein n=1 Tax=Spiribacter vilamensis TaxID=531306 RepID=A0A4Q8CYI8_9GAMM|nr:hypothetical protein [Spiribacter vilamensis]RZU98024.1 hypothetical protein EV698_0260 [Spiribacter vilamensis]TVO61071.1 hypothetical protein FPL09_02630 [Spiribacter vilamensis]
MSDYRRRSHATFALLAVAIVLAYLVPYGPLRGVALWQGAFLFWMVFGVVVIVLIGRLVADWRP